MTFLRKILFLILPICLSSCYGYYTSGVFTDLRENSKPLASIEEENCLKSDIDVKLYFEGEPINFEYERIGLVEAKGNSSANDIDVIKELKKEAKRKCCNAIIGIVKGNVQREGGLAFITDPKDEFKYNAITFSGIAIVKKN